MPICDELPNGGHITDSPYRHGPHRGLDVLVSSNAAAVPGYDVYNGTQFTLRVSLDAGGSEFKLRVPDIAHHAHRGPDLPDYGTHACGRLTACTALTCNERETRTFQSSARKVLTRHLL